MATILVKVQAKTGNRQIIDYRDGVLKILVGEPPVGGKANAAVIDLLSQALCVRRSQINLIRGLRSRRKVARVEGLSTEQTEARLQVHGKMLCKPEQNMPYV